MQRAKTQGKGMTPTDWEIYLGLSINTKLSRGVTKTTNSLQKMPEVPKGEFRTFHNKDWQKPKQISKNALLK